MEKVLILFNQFLPAHQCKNRLLSLIQVGGLDLSNKGTDVLGFYWNQAVCLYVQLGLEFINLLKVSFEISQVNFRHCFPVDIADLGEILNR